MESSDTSGTRECVPILIEGLKRLEYRGYDSAGVAVQNDGSARGGARRRARSAVLEERLAERRARGHDRHRPHPLGDARRAQRRQRPPAHRLRTAGSRWSTTASSRTTRCSRARSRPRATSSRTETDTEVLAHLIEEHLQRGLKLEQAVGAALRDGRGHLRHRGDVRRRARHDRRRAQRQPAGGRRRRRRVLRRPPTSPPIVEHTRQVVYLDDGEMAVLTPDGFHTATIDARARSTRTMHEVEWDLAPDREGRLRALHAQGDLRAARRRCANAMRGRLHRRPRGWRGSAAST